MDEKKDQPEPTMEEILASIRRIISEDAEEEGKAEEAKVEAGEEEPAGGPPEEPISEEPADDIFELTQVADEPDIGSIDIPESVPDDLAVPEPERELPPRPELAPEPQTPPQVAADPEPAPAPPAGDEIFADETFADDEAIISSGPAAATTAAFAGLMGSLQRPSGPSGDMPIGNSGLTLEELVRQMIRPMLREWLDANLPGLVERLVKREIERMVRRAED